MTRAGGVSLLIATALVAGLFPPAAHAQDVTAKPACRDTVIHGRVTSGDSFEAPLPGGLVFRLDAEANTGSGGGWTIQVTAAADRDADYLWVATPPYRFANPRYLDTQYGVTASGALALSPREFAFVASPGDFARATAALDVLLWPGTHSDAEVAAADSTLERLPTYPGSVWIEDGAATEPSQSQPLGTIEWISFRAALCVPLLHGSD